MASKAETSSVFVRNSTGLVRELSGWDVFVMNTIGTNPMGNYAVLFTLGLAVFVGANLWLSTLTGIFIGISIVKTVPLGTLSRTRKEPMCSLMILFAMARPSPVPSLFVEK